MIGDLLPYDRHSGTGNKYLQYKDKYDKQVKIIKVQPSNNILRVQSRRIQRVKQSNQQEDK